MHTPKTLRGIYEAHCYSVVLVIETSFYHVFQRALRSHGEPPVIIDEKTERFGNLLRSPG